MDLPRQFGFLMDWKVTGPFDNKDRRGHETVFPPEERLDFAAVYPAFSDDIRWNLVGDEPLIGRDTVVAACDKSAAYLEAVMTKFSKFRTISNGDSVGVDTTAEYSDTEGAVSLIASCDIYDFRDGKLAEITSYTFELATAEVSSPQ